MSLDFSKLHDAIGKVADLAKSHADVSALWQDAKTEGQKLIDDAKAEGQKLLDEALSAAQKEVDALAEQLLAAAGTPAEQAGIAAVASALSVAPAPAVTVAPVAPVAPQAAVSALGPQAKVTFLPGDPRAG